MDSQLIPFPASQLPIKRDLKPVSVFTIILSILKTAASISGLLFQTSLYPTDELRQAYLVNDVVNLMIGVPILLGSMWLTRRGKLIGLLCWPGALLSTLYNYIIYLIGMPFGWATPVFATLVVLSAYPTGYLLRHIDSDVLKTQLAGKVSEKISGGVLAFFGTAFFFLAVGVIAEARTNQTTLPMTELGLAIADMILSVFLIFGGILLIQRKPAGYAIGLGLLFATSMLLLGVILVVILQPVMLNIPFSMEDVIVLTGMGLICFIPTGLFMRGVVAKI